MTFRNPLTSLGTLLVIFVVVSACGCDESNPTNDSLSPSLSNIQLTPASPATLVAGERVNFTFDYTDMLAGGGRIYLEAFSAASESGSSLYPAGSGSGTAFVTVETQSAPDRVDSLRFRIVDTSGTQHFDTLLYVEYDWTALVATTPTVANIQLTPGSPATLAGGEKVNISFDYADLPVGGGNVYVFPYPPTGWSGSPLYPEGNGSGTAWVLVDAPSVPARVDSLTFQITDAIGNTLNDTTMAVDYNWQ